MGSPALDVGPRTVPIRELRIWTLGGLTQYRAIYIYIYMCIYIYIYIYIQRERERERERES